jgi:hypothetical protein
LNETFSLEANNRQKRLLLSLRKVRLAIVCKCYACFCWGLGFYSSPSATVFLTLEVVGDHNVIDSHRRRRPTGERRTGKDVVFTKNKEVMMSPTSME